MYVCMYVCMSAYMYVCMYVYVCMHVCMYVCMYVCMCPLVKYHLHVVRERATSLVTARSTLDADLGSNECEHRVSLDGTTPFVLRSVPLRRSCSPPRVYVMHRE